VGVEEMKNLTLQQLKKKLKDSPHWKRGKAHRITVFLYDDTYKFYKKMLPKLNASALFREALRAVKEIEEEPEKFVEAKEYGTPKGKKKCVFCHREENWKKGVMCFGKFICSECIPFVQQLVSK